MEIERTRPESKPGPADWFTGDVWLDTIKGADEGASKAQALSIHFSPGARTA